jgi:branched-chain amino acid transport system permease protein
MSAQRVFAAAGLGLAAALPLILGASSTALENLILAAAYVIMALGLNIVVGFAGLLDLGYVVFFAIGAHVAAHFGSAFWADAASFSLLVGEPAAGMPGIHLNFLIILVLAIVATTTAGVLIGVPTLRLHGAYIGIVTGRSSCSVDRSPGDRRASPPSTRSTCRSSGASARSTCVPGTGSRSRSSR